MIDKYKHMSVTDLAQDQSFIGWVLHKRGKDRQFWENWLSKNPEKADDIEAAKAIVQMLEFADTPYTSRQKDNLWASIDAAIEEEAIIQKMPTRRIMKWAIGAVAASILALWGVSFLRDSGSVEIQTAAAQWEQFELPDQSKVALNAVSKINYHANNWDEERSLQLEGQAYFDVEKGQTFTVHTPRGTIEVLGTEFDVLARPNRFRVVCYEGRVSVKTANHEETITAGQAVIWENGTLKLDLTKRKMKAPLWIDGYQELGEVNLKMAMDALERQYGVTIMLDEAMNGVSYKGGFDRQKPFEEELKRMIFVSGQPLDAEKIGPDSYRVFVKQNN